MAIYRPVQVNFWHDNFVINLTPEEKYFYLYLMTNEKTTQCGIYEIPIKIIEMDTGYNRDTVIKLLDRFIEYGKIRYNYETGELIVLNWIKHNKPDSKNIITCVEKELKLVKEESFKKEFYDICRKYGYPIEAPCKPLISPLQAPCKKEKEKEKEEKEEEEKEEEEEEEKEEVSTEVDCCNKLQPVIDKWNDLNLQRIVSINPGTNRHKSLTLRLKEYGIESVFLAIDSIKGSDFLRGQNKTGWLINFDWFIKPNNFVKVLEGNYKNNEENIRSTGTSFLDINF